jgi:hypothetical protein
MRLPVKHTAGPVRGKVLVSALVVALGLLGVFSATVAASPGSGEICSDCHKTAGAAPTVAITSADGVSPVVYAVHQTSTAWAAFDLSNDLKRLGGGSASDGTFTAPLGHFVRVCSSEGYSTGTWTQAYILTPKAPNDGMCAPGIPQVVAPHGSLTFTFTADPAYHLADVKVDGVSDPAAVIAGAYTFTDVQADRGVAPTFAADFNTITPTAGPNGAVSPATPQSVASGGSITFTALPSSGYKVDTATVDGVTVALAADDTYTFTNVVDKHSFNVTFKAAVAKCSAAITLSGLKSGVLKLHKSLTIRCSVRPAHAAKTTIAIQRRSGSKWVTVKTASRTLGITTGACSYSYRPAKTGTYRVKTSVAKTAAFLAATATKTFKVK